MSADAIPFRRGVIRPMECLTEGHELAKSDYWNLFVICLVGLLIAALIPLGLGQGAMMCGMYMCILRTKRGRKASTDLLFKGFDYFIQSFLAVLLLSLPMLLIVGMMIFVMVIVSAVLLPAGGNAGPILVTAAFGVFGLITMVLSLAVHAVATFVFPLMVDYKLPAVEAVKTGYRAAMANLSGLILLVLLNSLILMVGALACYVGMLFVFPIALCAQAVAYEKVFADVGDEYQPDSPYDS